MKILLTGGTGFIGRHVVRELLAAGHQVFALARQKPMAAEPGIVWILGDLADASLEDHAPYDVLVHLAAHGVVGPASWEDCFRVNVTDSLRLLEASLECSVQKLVIGGSCFEYGRSGERLANIPVDAPLEPVGAYSASKAAFGIAAAALARSQKKTMVLLRLFHVFGEGEAPSRFWPSLRRAALAGEDFPMTAGEQIRDFIPVENVARVVSEAVERNDLVSGEPLMENVGTGQPQSLRAFAEYWWKKWGAPGKLLIGVLPYRPDEVMCYVPQIKAK